MNNRDGGSAEETPRTVADLLAQYGDGAVQSGGRRRRRATDPEETAPQSIIDRVLSDSGTMRRVDENGHPVPLPAPVRPTGSHRPMPPPGPSAPPQPPPASSASSPSPASSSPSPPGRAAPPRAVSGLPRPAPPRMAPPSPARPAMDDYKPSDTGAHRTGTGPHRLKPADTGAHRPDTGPHRPGPSDTGAHRPGPSDTGAHRPGPMETGPHRYNPSETGPQRYPQDRYKPSETGPQRFNPSETGPHRLNPADTGSQRPVLPARPPVDRPGRPDDSGPNDLSRTGLRRDPGRRDDAATDKFPRIEAVTLNPTGAPPVQRPGRRGRHQPDADEQLDQTIAQPIRGLAVEPARAPGRSLVPPHLSAAAAPPAPPPLAPPADPGVNRRFDDDDVDDELDDEYDDEEFDDEDDDFDDEESPVKEWLVMIGQLAVGAIGGAGLWLGFQWLWRAMPLVSLGVALVVISALVWVVRRIRRSDDLQTTVVTVLVGLFVTVSPAALLLVSR